MGKSKFKNFSLIYFLLTGYKAYNHFIIAVSLIFYNQYYKVIPKGESKEKRF